MTVLAIDPGNEQSGMTIWNGEKVVSAGVERNDVVRQCIRRLSKDQFGDIWVDVLAIEQVGHYGSGMSAGATVFDTCIEIGRMIECWGRDNGLQLVLRQKIKTHLCGSPRATDSNVRQAVIDRLGKPGTKKAPGPTYGVKAHCWSALALAVYVCDMERVGALGRTA